MPCVDASPAGRPRSKGSTPRLPSGLADLPTDEAVELAMQRAEEEAVYYMGNLAEIRFDILVECLLELQHEENVVARRISQLSQLKIAKRDGMLDTTCEATEEQERSGNTNSQDE